MKQLLHRSRYSFGPIKNALVLSILLLSFLTSPSLAQVDPEFDEIEFDPETGIVLPPDDPVETGPTIESFRKLYPGAKQEDYLLKRVEEDQPQVMEEEDGEKGYIDRQIDKQFGQFRDYIREIGVSYQKVFSWLLGKLLWFLEELKHWPIPPPILSIPLIGLIYFLTSYPLMRIARTVTNDDWMAWVPILQLVLLLKITERSLLTLLVFLIPVANIFLFAIIFMEICDMFRQPPWYGLFILIPGLNIALLWYLAAVEFD